MPFPYPWLFALLGGAIILGVMIAYSAFRSARNIRRQRNAAARGLRDLENEDRGRT